MSFIVFDAPLVVMLITISRAFEKSTLNFERLPDRVLLFGFRNLGQSSRGLGLPAGAYCSDQAIGLIICDRRRPQGQFPRGD
jgi:hypothetical protein